MIFTHIFFDLDGTLIDSSEGIHNGFVQTFERLSLPVPSDQKIRSFMGPPLEVTFKEEISEDGAEQAVQLYRDYYGTKGQFEAHLYDGIREVLEKLSQNPNKKIYITTSKNEPTALEMCEYLGIGQTKARELLSNPVNGFTVRIGNRLYAHKGRLDHWLLNQILS